MFRSFLVLCICSVGFSVTLGFNLFEDHHQECGPNEIAKGCINPCPPQKTCQDRNTYACQGVVVAACDYQCHCKEGFIRKTEGGECIPEKECDCGPNEVLNHCVEPCGGEDSCYDRDQIECPDVIRACITACVCKDGFIRKTVFSECIPKEECRGPCDTFEQYSECKQISKEICSSIVDPPKSDDSTEACTSGCTCWDGYYRENETSPCLDRCLCPEMENSPDCESWWTPIDLSKLI